MMNFMLHKVYLNNAIKKSLMLKNGYNGTFCFAYFTTIKIFFTLTRNPNVKHNSSNRDP